MWKIWQRQQEMTTSSPAGDSTKLCLLPVTVTDVVRVTFTITCLTFALQLRFHSVLFVGLYSMLWLRLLHVFYELTVTVTTFVRAAVKTLGAPSSTTLAKFRVSLQIVEESQSDVLDSLPCANQTAWLRLRLEWVASPPVTTPWPIQLQIPQTRFRSNSLLWISHNIWDENECEVTERFISNPDHNFNCKHKCY